MTVNWEAISTIADIVGIVIIVASLFYVARQVRQNTDAILTSSRQGLLESDLGLFSDFMTFSVDPHLVRDDVKLTLEEERRFVWLLVKAIRIREFAWHQYKSGNLDEKSWQSYMAPVPEMFSTNRAKAVLKFYTGSPEFAAVLADWLPAGEEDSEGQPRQATSDLIQGLYSRQSAKND
ncbi:hypothetical protein ACFOOP_01625 [Marinicaulis aureus]|uniref:DUF4760 domain-containing protein n=1 Tax=Hyphococcus aureus TaxID=2666033 RepID=A0ABW1KTW0_9PROT